MSEPKMWVPGRDKPMLTIDLMPLGETAAVPGILVLPQHRTEQILLEAAKASGLADIRFDHRVTRFEQDESGVTVTTESPGGRGQERGQYLVGCDGAHSAVREGLGLPLEGKTYPARLLLADVRLEDARDALPWPRVTVLEGAAVGGGVLVGIRIEPRVWRLIASVAAPVTDEEAGLVVNVAPLVNAVLGPGPFGLVWASTFRIHCRTSPAFRRGRVLLAGDAAHINSPAGGQGMNSGIQDAHNLAWKLARALAGGQAEPLLASYEAERRPVILTNVERYTDLLTRGVLLAPRAVRLGALAVARLGLGTSLVQQRLLRRAGMLDTRYRKSPLISGVGRWLGARAPNVRAVHNGVRGRLHDVATRDAALLLFDDGRLPTWDVPDIRRKVQHVNGLTVIKVAQREGAAGLGGIVDAEGAVWREWNPPTGTAALLRPDGHVGWMGRHPTIEELVEGVARGLGA